MAQDIDLLGAVYPDVPAVELPTDGGGSALFYDVSDTTAGVSDVASGEYFYTAAGVRSLGTGKYAQAPVANGNATIANAILYGNIDDTSTATTMTATVPGLTSYYDGVTVMLHNGVVTSASPCTININGLGAKPFYNNMTNATRDTTIFNVAYTMLFVYASDLNSGSGGWWCYRGYDANTNTIGYQLRTNSTAMTTAIRSRYYRIFFTSADDTKWEPANTGYDNSATSAKTVNTRPIDPFGRIVYTSANTNYTAGAVVAAATIWDRYALNLGYSFNRTGSALTLTYPAPVYVKCAPQADGSAVIDSTTPIVQALPSTNDGKIYIFLGVAYSATNIELVDWHPIYWNDGTAVRLWTGAKDVHSVSVTQVVSTGTKIATVTVDGTGTDLYAPSGGGGSVSYSTMSVSLPVSGWSGNAQTVNASIVTASNDVVISPQPSDAAAWGAAGVVCTAQGSGTLTFSCTTTPSATLKTNVMAFDGGTHVVSDYSITLSLTNPVFEDSPSDFQYCRVDAYENGEPVSPSLAELTNPAGSASFEISPTYSELSVLFSSKNGEWVDTNKITCIGGVAYSRTTIMGEHIFTVTGDGTITIDGVEYSD